MYPATRARKCGRLSVFFLFPGYLWSAPRESFSSVFLSRTLLYTCIYVYRKVWVISFGVGGKKGWIDRLKRLRKSCIRRLIAPAVLCFYINALWEESYIEVWLFYNESHYEVRYWSLKVGYLALSWYALERGLRNDSFIQSSRSALPYKKEGLWWCAKFWVQDLESEAHCVFF